MKISIRVTSRYEWPNGKPVASAILSDGKIRHVLEDGRAVTVSEPNYRLEYLSTWVGAEQDETYDVNIAIVGLSPVEGFYQTWNFDIGELRNYSFAKTKRIVHLTTGEVFTGVELWDSLSKL
jgi:hypothetical protein